MTTIEIGKFVSETVAMANTKQDSHSYYQKLTKTLTAAIMILRKKRRRGFKFTLHLMTLLHTSDLGTESKLPTSLV